MLIYTSRYPGWGKQKPKQWGPISAVRSAVFHNAEKLGIDPSSLTAYWPGNEGAGNARSIINPIHLLTPTYTAGWVNEGMQTVQSSSSYDPWNGPSNLVVGKNQLTFLLPKVIITGVESSTFIAGQASPTTSGYDWGIYCGGTNEFSCFVETSSVVNSASGVTLVNGATHQLGLVYDGVNVASVVDGAIINPQTQTGNIVNTLPFQIGAWQSDTFGAIYAGGTLIFDGALNADQILQLHETPYALLQPVPRILYFDVAGGSPAPWSGNWFGTAGTPFGS